MISVWQVLSYRDKLVYMSKDLISLIKEYHETYKTNPVYIPLATFRRKGADENNTTLSIEKLQQDKVIKETHNVFGRYERVKKLSELERGKFAEHASYLKKVVSEPTDKESKWHFYKFLDYIPNEQELVDELSENPDRELKESLEPFIEIKVNPERLKQSPTQEGKIKIYITKEGATFILSKEKGGKLNYKCSSSTKKKIIDYFWKNKDKGFIKTKKIANTLKIEPTPNKTSVQIVRDEIGKINDSMYKKFGIENIIISDQPKNEGYSFNLKFEIEIVNE